MAAVTSSQQQLAFSPLHSDHLLAQNSIDRDQDILDAHAINNRAHSHASGFHHSNLEVFHDSNSSASNANGPFFTFLSESQVECEPFGQTDLPSPPNEATAPSTTYLYGDEAYAEALALLVDASIGREPLVASPVSGSDLNVGLNPFEDMDADGGEFGGTAIAANSISATVIGVPTSSNPFEEHDSSDVVAVPNSVDTAGLAPTAVSTNPFEDDVGNDNDDSGSMSNVPVVATAVGCNPFDDDDDDCGEIATIKASCREPRSIGAVIAPAVAVAVTYPTVAPSSSSSTVPRSHISMQQLRRLLCLGYTPVASNRALVESNGDIPIASTALYNSVKNLMETSSTWRPMYSARVVSWLPILSLERGGKDYTGYIVSISINRSTLSWRITKRYSEFVQLNKRINSLLPRSVIERMMCKFPSDESMFSVFSTVTDAQRNERCKGLSTWLQEVCLNASICGLAAVFDELTMFLEATDPMNSLPTEYLHSAATNDTFRVGQKKANPNNRRASNRV